MIEHSIFTEVGRTDLVHVCVYVYKVMLVAAFQDTCVWQYGRWSCCLQTGTATLMLSLLLQSCTSMLSFSS